MQKAEWVFVTTVYEGDRVLWSGNADEAHRLMYCWPDRSKVHGVTVLKEKETNMDTEEVKKEKKVCDRIVWIMVGFGMLFVCVAVWMVVRIMLP